MARETGPQEPGPPRRGSYFGGGLRWIALAVVVLVIALIGAIIAMNLDEDDPDDPVRTITPEATSYRVPPDQSPWWLAGPPAV